MKNNLITFQDPKSPISEIFKTLRTNIQFMDTKKTSKVIQVTSTFPSEGKSWVSSNLAVTFAQTGKKVLIIDSDMRRGRQYSIFNIYPKPGLSNYLSGVNINDEEEQNDIIYYVQRTNVENLDVMPAGSIPPNPSELLSSEQMLNLIERARQLWDIIIIDGTPTQLVTDSLIISRIVDENIIVVAYNQTKKEDLKRIVTNMQNVGAKILGVVLNKIPISSKKYEERYYYNSTTSSSSSSSSKKKKGNRMKTHNFEKSNNSINEISDIRYNTRTNRTANNEQNYRINQFEGNIDNGERNLDQH